MKLTFTGDAMCEYTRLALHYNDEKKQYDFTDVFSGLSKCFKKSDYTVVNLETPLAGEEQKYSYKNFSFNTPSEFAEALVSSGVNMVTTANNHALDRGIIGLKKTIYELDRIGIDHTGTFEKPEGAHPLIKDIEGVKVGFLSYTYGTEACFNHNYLRKNEQYYVNLLREQELSNPIKRFFLTNTLLPAKVFRLFYRIISPQNARKSPSDRLEKDTVQKKHLIQDIEYCHTHGAEYIILCLHCGGQFNEKPTAYTKSVCDFARKQGVDFIVGNHEHCIQLYDEEKHTVYSLGNLTSDYSIERPPYNRLAEYSILFHLYLEKKNNGIESECAFSIAKSVKNEQGEIVSRLISDIYAESDSLGRTKLLEDTKLCVQIFLNKKITSLEIKEEYYIRDFA